MGVDERERQEIHEAQTREQTVTYFELIRSLFGKIKEQYNAAQLVRQLHELNPYPEKTEGGKEQLGVLLQYESSGLTAVTYDEASSQVVQLGSKLAQLPTEELNNVLIHFNREKASVAKLRKDLSDAVL
ncbi:hypothetical protein ADEAN_000062700 [Angomonas deanei]|uniref:Uncharacterized protein n=1 Tax=Angomonas deanei TaxID=59799 RepID=A0A7G2C1U3_9TRYP|nr:hypothetical protein ADEAN_000062700 [Angomonas deanei]